jgi:hypothetical protein
MMIVEKQMECRLCRGNRSSRRKPAPAPLLSITKSHMTRPGFEPGPSCWEASDFFFYYEVCEAIGTAATPGLLCQPRVIVKMMIVEKQVECRLCRGNRSSRRKPASAPLLSLTKSHTTRSRFEPVLKTSLVTVFLWGKTDILLFLFWGDVDFKMNETRCSSALVRE